MQSHSQSSKYLLYTDLHRWCLSRTIKTNWVYQTGLDYCQQKFTIATLCPWSQHRKNSKIFQFTLCSVSHSLSRSRLAALRPVKRPKQRLQTLLKYFQLWDWLQQGHCCKKSEKIWISQAPEWVCFPSKELFIQLSPVHHWPCFQYQEDLTDMGGIWKGIYQHPIIQWSINKM